jgi:hypothetical protein
LWIRTAASDAQQVLRSSHLSALLQTGNPYTTSGQGSLGSTPL